jgi:hypothetical protein
MSTMPQQKRSMFPVLASQDELDGEIASPKDPDASHYEESESFLSLWPAFLLVAAFLGYFLAG